MSRERSGRFVPERDRRDVEHALKNGLPNVERLDAMLRKITYPNIMPELALASLYRQDASEQFQEGRFAGSVWSDEHSALPALGGKV